MSTQWERARKQVLLRDGGKCLFCLGDATDVHHRRPKGMGGTSNSYIAFGMANLVSLCREHHSWIHAHPEQGYKSGFLVHSWEDPADIPLVLKPGSFLIKLTPSGELERMGEPDGDWNLF